MGAASQTAVIFSVSMVEDTVTDKIWYSYRAMHFSAKRGIAIACRLSVRPFVRL